MDALDVIKVSIRRWYVMLPVLLLAAALGYQLVSNQKPVYTAYASYGLVYNHGDLIKGAVDDPRNANPLGTALLAEALRASLTSTSSQAALGLESTSGVAPGQKSDGSRYSVVEQQNSPSYSIQAWGPDAAAVSSVVTKVLSQTAPLAEEIQVRAGAPVNSRYGTFTVSPTQTAELPAQSAIKLMLAVAGVGVLTGAALSILVERLLSRRRSTSGQHNPIRTAQDDGVEGDRASLSDSAEASSTDDYREYRPLHQSTRR